MLHLGLSLGECCPSAAMQSVYSTSSRSRLGPYWVTNYFYELFYFEYEVWFKKRIMMEHYSSFQKSNGDFSPSEQFTLKEIDSLTSTLLFKSQSYISDNSEAFRKNFDTFERNVFKKSCIASLSVLIKPRPVLFFLCFLILKIISKLSSVQ